MLRSILRNNLPWFYWPTNLFFPFFNCLSYARWNNIFQKNSDKKSSNTFFRDKDLSTLVWDNTNEGHALLYVRIWFVYNFFFTFNDGEEENYFLIFCLIITRKESINEKLYELATKCHKRMIKPHDEGWYHFVCSLNNENSQHHH